MFFFCKEIESAQYNDMQAITKTIRDTCREKMRKELRIKNLAVCSYHVTYSFQSESELYNFLNAKVILAQNRHDI